jgi:PAS domain S-box-containing protein
MDIRIAGSMDGIQTARLLRSMYHVPVIFLTSYSDDTTATRAAKECPYGYLTKPFQRAELKATLRVALHKAKKDAGVNTAHEAMAATVGSMREAVLTVSLDHQVQFMNIAAEELIGLTLAQTKGKKLYEALNLMDNRQRTLPDLNNGADATPLQWFGLSLSRVGRVRTLVDFSVTPLADPSGQRTGFVVTMRDASERLRSQAVEEAFYDVRSFDQAPMAMVQLDSEGHIIRVNEALLQESGIAAERLLGRSLTGLSMDPDPRIAKHLMHMLLQGSTSVATVRPRLMN